MYIIIKIALISIKNKEVMSLFNKKHGIYREIIHIE